MGERNRNSLTDFLYRSGILKDAITGGRAKSGDTSRPPFFGLAAFVGTAGGAGLAPFAQGTFGSLVPPIVYSIMPHCWKSWNAAWPWLIPVITVAVYFAGVWASFVCETVWGHDPGRVVIDEVAGTLTTLLFIPLSYTTVGLGFVLFRAFDIFKPWPVRRFERFNGGWGVMNDDIAAGVLANVVLRIVIFGLSHAGIGIV